MALAPAVQFGAVHDFVVFKYDDTLSLPIPDGQKHLRVGAPVVINKETGVGGILQTDVAPEHEAVYNHGSLMGRPTYGFNQPGYASVLRRGVVRIQGESAAGAKVGDPVYVKATTGNAGEPAVSLAKAGADLILGFLYQAPKTDSGKQELLVVLAPSKA